MSSAPESPGFKKEPPKEKDFKNPGLRGVRTTTLFRAVNPELFIKPVRNIPRIRHYVQSIRNRKCLFSCHI
uniref:small integral membrane protein 8-like n=1 Tax=Panthera onca TaxID=9690 RepID=UPI002952DFD4|nr:small integral membrane protein 8-like [Panthera onca]XP_060484909.1 small integral membrane protein 8-like [Panthera onca]XP_060484911.1 small integral membrane protein 8-like [Panthera onca]